MDALRQDEFQMRGYALVRCVRESDGLRWTPVVPDVRVLLTGPPAPLSVDHFMEHFLPSLTNPSLCATCGLRMYEHTLAPALLRVDAARRDLLIASEHMADESAGVREAERYDAAVDALIAAVTAQQQAEKSAHFCVRCHHRWAGVAHNICGDCHRKFQEQPAEIEELRKHLTYARQDRELAEQQLAEQQAEITRLSLELFRLQEKQP